MPYPTPFAAKTTHEKKHPRQRITNGGSNALTWGFSLLMSRRRRWSLHHGTFGAQFWQEGEVGLALGILVLVWNLCSVHLFFLPDAANDPARNFWIWQENWSGPPPQASFLSLLMADMDGKLLPSRNHCQVLVPGIFSWRSGSFPLGMVLVMWMVTTMYVLCFSFLICICHKLYNTICILLWSK